MLDAFLSFSFSVFKLVRFWPNIGEDMVDTRTCDALNYKNIITDINCKSLKLIQVKNGISIPFLFIYLTFLATNGESDTRFRATIGDAAKLTILLSPMAL